MAILLLPACSTSSMLEQQAERWRKPARTGKPMEHFSSHSPPFFPTAVVPLFSSEYQPLSPTSFPGLPLLQLAQEGLHRAQVELEKTQFELQAKKCEWGLLGECRGW